MKTADELYLDLVMRSLTNITYAGMETQLRYMFAAVNGQLRFDRGEMIAIEETNSGRATTKALLAASEDGRMARPSIHAMMGRKRLQNIVDCVRSVSERGIPGDLIECGVWKGAGGIMMMATLLAVGDESRAVWLADSFKGVPKSTLPQDEGLYLSSDDLPGIAVSEARVRELMDRYGVLNDRIHFLPGWFEDSLPSAPIERIAVLRTDGDLYKSTRDVLCALYDKVTPGGYVIIDDYGDIPACKQAVDEFRAERSIEDAIIHIDWTGVYWRKS